MAEAKRLKTGRWRIYRDPKRGLVRDPDTGTIATFSTLGDAKRWWSKVNPTEPSLQEAHKCARCGAYFGADTPWRIYNGKPYHVAHVPNR